MQVVELDDSQSAELHTGDTEVMILPLAGGGSVECDDETFDLTPRASVFDGPSDMVYIGIGTFADIFTGLYATIGILAALGHRDRTGEGQLIDVALLDAQVAVLANQALNYLVGGTPPPRLGNAHPNIVPYQTFATRDGHIIIAVGTDRQFREFCAIAGIAELAQDARFLTNRARVESRQALIPLIARAMRARTTEEWIEALEPAAVPCGPINSLDQVFADAQVRHRNLRRDLKRRDGVATPTVANPLNLSATPVSYDRPAPKLGEHTGEVLGELLGFDEARLAELRRLGVIA